MKPVDAARAAQTTAGRGTRRGSARVGRKALPALLAGAAMLVAGCGGSGTAAGSAAGKGVGKADSAAVKQISTARVSISVRDGAQNVATRDALRITATRGTLTAVKVVSDDGDTVAGVLSADRRTWTTPRYLHTSTRYTVTATAKDSKGLETTEHSTFTTLTPQNKLIGYYNFVDGHTYGVGMEVSITFNHPVRERREVLDHLHVTADPGVEIAPHWFGSQRVDFRPEDFWRPGTKVTLSYDLAGVEAAPGVYGYQDKSVSFTVGRSQVSVADAAADTMKVIRDGKVVKKLLISAGDAKHPTYNGTMVIQEKLVQTRMNSQTVGLGKAYDIGDVPHAMRLTTSGTFVHGNYWRPVSTFGSINTSHGCVGLHDVKGGHDTHTPAAWMFAHSLIGDVVVVKHAKDGVVAPDNGWNGWDMSWSAWKSGA